MKNNGGKQNEHVDKLIAPSLYRVTEGVPYKELQQMVSEAKESEAQLKKDIEKLEEALKDPKANESAVNIMLASEMTPPDRFFSVSALLGRLRAPLATPLPPNSSLVYIRKQQQEKVAALKANSALKSSKKQQQQKAQSNSNKASRAMSPPPKSDPSYLLQQQQKLLQLESIPEYRRVHTEPAQLLACWKRISSHKTAAVFRRPVNPKEAPGYTERILFPMDLSLIRKLITSSGIKSFAGLHQKVGMICHNCVKYNGRESDYGLVTRDFEAVADDMIIQAVMNPNAGSRRASPATTSSKPSNGASSSSLQTTTSTTGTTAQKSK